MNLTISKKGIPCLWEWGGGWTSTGTAMIIADYKGDMKKAIYVRKHGNLCNNDHALIPVREGDHLIFAERARGVMTYQVQKIDKIDLENEIAECIVLDEIPIYLEEAIKACVAKCDDYHCRDVYYAIYE